MAEETAQEESGDIRRKAFVRLGIAAVVTIVALGALWWLDNSGKPAPKPKPAAPAPIVAAPPQQPPAEPQPAAEPEPVPAPEIPEPAPPEQEAEPASPPPPPKVGALPPPRTTHAPAPASRPSKEPPPPPPAQPTPAPDNYVVQIGVFTNLAHAQQLVERLNKQGIHAYTETRVHVGPFATREEAEKAQATLKKLGVSGLIAQPATTK